MPDDELQDPAQERSARTADATIQSGEGGFRDERYSDDQARAAFEMVLSYRRKAEEHPEAAEDHALSSAMIAGELMRGIMLWAAEALGFLYDPAEAQRPPVEEACWIIARTLDLGLPVMQPSARACQSLNAV